jgi:hypothetical protein
MFFIEILRRFRIDESTYLKLSMRMGARSFRDRLVASRRSHTLCALAADRPRA